MLNPSATRPNVKMNLVVSAVLGLVAGLLGAILKDLLDRTIKTPADIEGIVGLPVLGVLPLVNESARKASYYGRKRKAATDQDDSPAEFLVHNLPKSGAAEAARAIRTNLQFMALDRPTKALLVTSAGPGEGKTTIACTIAIALAQAGHRVVIVDCDLRRPRIGRLFDVPGDVGVSSVLVGDATAESLPMATQIERLDVVSSGPIPPNPSELLQSDRFRQLLAYLVGRYDRVVIDSPPILPITDAAVLATQVDGLVLVTRAFKTTKEHAKQARRTIETIGGRIFGCVLNAIDLSKVEYKNYYYHYYKKDTYGYGYNSSSQEAAGK
jgi:capsular exopolysaccharide synthesis family protein